MTAEVGDCATILEQFIHDAANLPAEINYMMEEIQAIDKEQQKHLVGINSKESALQKQVKSHGSLVAHPKEHEFAAYTRKHYDLCIDLQQKKINHSDKACTMMDRQLKRIDERIQQLIKHGHLDEDTTLPSVFSRKPDNQKLPFDVPTSTIPLQAANVNALNANSAVRLNPHVTPTIRQPQPRQIVQVATVATPAQRSSTPVTPVAALPGQKLSQEREQSAGADSKRRKLNMSTTGINLPTQPSGLRQSSIGPGTPKIATPTGSRAGSLPRTTGPLAKKSIAGVTGAIPKKGVTHQQVTKLKNKHTKHARLSQSGIRKKAGSPAVRGVRGETEASEESVLSSAEASDTDTSQAKRRRKKQVQEPEPQTASDEDGEDETDDKLYCYCNQRSYGEMVGCENEHCKREWFHISCLNLKTVPQEEHWFCPECRMEEGANKKRK